MSLQGLHQKCATGRDNHVAIGEGVLRRSGAGGEVVNSVVALATGVARINRNLMRSLVLVQIANGFGQPFESLLEMCRIVNLDDSLPLRSWQNRPIERNQELAAQACGQVVAEVYVQLCLNRAQSVVLAAAAGLGHVHDVVGDLRRFF